MSRLAELRNKKRELSAGLDANISSSSGMSSSPSTSNPRLPSTTPHTPSVLSKSHPPEESSTNQDGIRKIMEPNDISSLQQKNKLPSNETECDSLKPSNEPNATFDSEVLTVQNREGSHAKQQNITPTINMPNTTIYQENKAPRSRLELLKMKKEILVQKSTKLLSTSAESNPLLLIMQRQVEALKDQIKDLELQLESMELERDIALEELEILKETIGDTPLNIISENSYTQKIESLENEVAKLIDEKKTLKNTLASVNERLDILNSSESMIESITTRNLALEEKIKTYENQVRDLKELVDMGEEIEAIHAGDIEVLRAELRSKESAVIQLQTELQNSKKELEAKSDLLERYKEKLAQISNQIVSQTIKIIEDKTYTKLDNDQIERLTSSLDTTRLLHSIAKIQVAQVEEVVLQMESFLPSNLDSSEIVPILTTASNFRSTEKKLETIISHILEIAKRQSDTQDDTIDEEITLKNRDISIQLAIALSVLRYISLQMSQLIDYTSGDKFNTLFHLLGHEIEVFDKEIDTFSEKISDIPCTSLQYFINDRLSNFLVDIVLGLQRNFDINTTQITFKTYRQLVELCLLSLQACQGTYQKLTVVLKSFFEIVDSNIAQKTNSKYLDTTQRFRTNLSAIDENFVELSRLLRRHSKLISSFSLHTIATTPLVELVTTLQQIFITLITDNYLTQEKYLKISSLASEVDQQPFQDSQQNKEIMHILTTMSSSDIQTSHRFHSSILLSTLTKLIPSFFLSNVHSPLLIDSFEHLIGFIESIRNANNELLPILNHYEQDPDSFPSFSVYSNASNLQQIKELLSSVPFLKKSIGEKDELVLQMKEQLNDSKEQITKLSIERSNLEQHIKALKDHSSVDIQGSIKHKELTLRSSNKIIKSLTDKNSHYEEVIKQLKEEVVSLQSLKEKLQIMLQHSSNVKSNYDSIVVQQIRGNFDRLYSRLIQSSKLENHQKMGRLASNIRENTLRMKQTRMMRLQDTQMQSQLHKYLLESARTTIVDLSDPNSHRNQQSKKLDNQDQLAKYMNFSIIDKLL